MSGQNSTLTVPQQSPLKPEDKDSYLAHLAQARKKLLALREARDKQEKDKSLNQNNSRNDTGITQTNSHSPALLSEEKADAYLASLSKTEAAPREQKPQPTSRKLPATAIRRNSVPSQSSSRRPSVSNLQPQQSHTSRLKVNGSNRPYERYYKSKSNWAKFLMWLPFAIPMVFVFIAEYKAVGKEKEIKKLHTKTQQFIVSQQKENINRSISTDLRNASSKILPKPIPIIEGYIPSPSNKQHAKPIKESSHHVVISKHLSVTTTDRGDSSAQPQTPTANHKVSAPPTPQELINSARNLEASATAVEESAAKVMAHTPTKAAAAKVFTFDSPVVTKSRAVTRSANNQKETTKLPEVMPDFLAYRTVLLGR